MPINNRFVTLLAQKSAQEKRRISIAEVSRTIGVTEKTLLGWANDTVTRFDAAVLEALCLYFSCQPGSLLEYIPPDDKTA